MSSPTTLPTVIGLGLTFGGPPLIVGLGEKSAASLGSLTVALLGQIALVAVCVAVLATFRFWERRPLSSIGLQALRWPSFAWGIALAGFLIFAFSPAAFWLLNHFELSGFDTGFSKLAVLPSWYRVLAVVIGGTVEEILYRGYAVEGVASLSGSYWIAGIVSVAASGVAHVPMWGWGASTTTFLSAGLATLFYLWRRDLDALIIAHVVTDFVGIVVTPLLRQAA